MEPSKYQIAERLLDGRTIIIRAIHPDDRERFAHAFQEFIKSPDSVRFRFHGFKRSLSESEAIQMTDIDFVDHVGLVATFGTDPEQPLIGVGRYIVCADAPKHHRAEVAFAVLDEHQGRQPSHDRGLREQRLPDRTLDRTRRRSGATQNRR